jgi:2-polyprenyl-3-methyl-5-hydroxy-6-metoxy-1,4-benzoquinol methylase
MVTAGYRRMRAAFDRHYPLDDRRGLHILDVGCGSGLCVNRLFSADCNFVLGVDLDESYVRLAATRFGRCRFLVCDAACLPVGTGHFDVVLLSSLIHHLSDERARQLFCSLSSAVTRDATVLVSEPVWSKSTSSNMLLRCDRGDYVRQPAEYRKLAETWFRIDSEFSYRYAATEFLGLVLRPKRGAEVAVHGAGEET